MTKSHGRLSVLCLLFLVASFYCMSRNSDSSEFQSTRQEELKHTKDTPETIKNNLKSQKAVLVDVREKSEWDAGHIKGAKLVSWSKLRFASSKNKLRELPDDDLIVYCYCKAGVRALKAGKKLKQIGYEVRPIKLGYGDLVKLGFEQEK